MKKQIIVRSLAVLMVLFLVVSFDATAAGKYKKVEIKTSAVCGMCKNRIEKNLSKETGIKKATLDVDTKVLTVKYDPAKTNPDEIRNNVSKIGYDADNVKKDQSAYKKLPKCCKLPEDR